MTTIYLILSLAALGILYVTHMLYITTAKDQQIHYFRDLWIKAEDERREISHELYILKKKKKDKV